MHYIHLMFQFYLCLVQMSNIHLIFAVKINLVCDTKGPTFLDVF